jgi:hypothetical protein
MLGGIAGRADRIVACSDNGLSPVVHDQGAKGMPAILTRGSCQVNGLPQKKQILFRYLAHGWPPVLEEKKRLRKTAVAAVRKMPLFKKSRAASGAWANSCGEAMGSTPILTETATMIALLVP